MKRRSFIKGLTGGLLALPVVSLAVKPKKEDCDQGRDKKIRVRREIDDAEQDFWLPEQTGMLEDWCKGGDAYLVSSHTFSQQHDKL